MNAAIVGIGAWLPEYIRTNDEWPADFTGHHGEGDRTFNDIPPPEDPIAAQILARDLMLEATDPFLGAVNRHVSNITYTEAETIAATRALNEAGIEGKDVDLVLSYSITSDMLHVPSAHVVAYNIGAKRASSFSVETACAAGITQLEIANAYIKSGIANTILLTQSHLLLRAMPILHPAAPGLGDAASAMVATGGDKGLIIRSTFGATHGEYSNAVVWLRNKDIEKELPWWKAGEDFRLGTRSPSAVKLLMRDTVSFGAETIREAALKAEIETNKISAICSVQPRGFIPKCIAERLGLSRDVGVSTYEEIAHVGACGPVFNLIRAKQLGLVEQGSFVALYGQGAGFVRASAILENL